MSPDRAPLGTAPRVLLAAAFFLSGAASLAYEVAWSRALLLLLGSTAAASAVVLGTFVGALGLGARWGGRRAERSARPLLLYGVLEVGAAAWAALSVTLTGLLQAPYVALAGGVPGWAQMLLRVVAAAVVVVPAAFLMGATLPAMVRHVVRREGETGRQTAWLYGANTVGAVAGCLLTGFVGVAAYGVTGVLWRAAALGAAVGLAAAWAGRRATDGVTARSADAMRSGGPRGSEPSGWRRPAQQAALLTGFVGLATEVVGFRVLVFFLEGFTATFAAMLGVFIAGLGIGSLVLGPVLARTERPARLLGLLLAGAAAALLLGLWVVVPSLEPWMKAIRAAAYAGAGGPGEIAAGLHLSAVLGAGLLLFVPALLLGPTFALCVRWAELDGEAPGHAVGGVYLWNSLGSLAAPLLFTFVVVPVFGVAGAWVMVSVLALVVGAALLRGLRAAGGAAQLRLAGLVGLAVGVGVMWLGPPGADGEALVRASVVMRGKAERRLLFVESDAVTTASVVENRFGERTLYTDDFAAAATGRHYRYMRMLGHLPAVLARDPRHAMVIAFGTGTTAGAVAQHEEVERLEVVEVSPAVLDMASWFQDANRFVLDDARTRVVRDDGRNALLLHESDLDLITLEPLMPYSPAGYPFYTLEFYELARERLREGGVLCQWIPVHAMPAGLYAAFLRTFFEVFPEGTLWFFEQSTVLVGRKGTSAPDGATVLLRLQAVADDLRDAGFERPELALAGYVASGREVLATDPPPSYRAYAHRPLTDLDPYPEFQPTPRAPLNTPYLHHTLTYLLDLAQRAAAPETRCWWTSEDGPAFHAAMPWALKGRMEQAQADFLEVALRGVSPGSEAWTARQDARLEALEDAARAYGQARRLVPGQEVLLRREVQVLRAMAGVRVRQLLARARALAQAGKAGEARELLVLAEGMTRAVLPPQLADPDPVATGRIETAALAAAVLLRLGRCAQAVRVLREARVDLADERREQPLVDLLDAVEAWQRGQEPGLAASAAAWAWVLEERAACRAEGLAPVQGEVEAYEREEGRAALRLQRLAARRLATAAEREGSREAVLAWLDARPPAGAAQGAALRAALRTRLDAATDALAPLLADEHEDVRRAALLEAGWWSLLGAHPEAMDRALASPEAATRKALATAAAEHGPAEALLRVARLLMDPDLDVRKEAWSVFVQHRPNLIEGYDPKDPDDARRPVVERLLEALGA